MRSFGLQRISEKPQITETIEEKNTMIAHSYTLSSRIFLSLTLFLLGTTIDCFGNSATAMLAANSVKAQPKLENFEIPINGNLSRFDRKSLQQKTHPNERDNSMCDREPRSCPPGGSR